MTNILFPIGTLGQGVDRPDGPRTLVAERLLYMPSMGFLLAAVCFARHLRSRSVTRTAFLRAKLGEKSIILFKKWGERW